MANGGTIPYFDIRYCIPKAEIHLSNCRFLILSSLNLTWQKVAIWMLASLLIAFAGPFGSFETQGLERRLWYWPTITGVSYVLGNAVYYWMTQFFGHARPGPRDGAVVLVMVVMLVPFIWVLTLGLTSPFEPGIRPRPVLLIAAVALITAAICVLRRLVPQLADLDKQETEATPSGPQPHARLMRRLPAEFSGKILRVSVRDHLVDVVSDQQTYTLRMRFGDAIHEVDQERGFLTHRSHWVSRDAIASVSLASGKVELELSNGDRIPVSRTYRPDLQQAGILGDL